MAIDTAEKRASLAGTHLYAAGPGVTVNASKDQEWRQEVCYNYSGITVSAPSTSGAWYYRIIVWLRRG